MTNVVASHSLVAELAPAAAEMAEWRHQIHSHPEIGFEEVTTAALVATKLKEFGCEVHTGIGGTGVVGVLRNGTSSRAVGLRADMDALPMQEANRFAHASHLEGRMHACGHDGHTASLLGAAKYLGKTRNFDGTAVLIFQPAEEIQSGASAMVKDGLFERFPVEAVFAYHNAASLPAGRFAVKSGTVYAGAATFEITVTGKGGHAALPDKTIDPVAMVFQIGTALQTIVSRNLSALQQGVVSITKIEGGDAYNVIPATAIMAGTLRALSMDVFEQIKTRIEAVSTGIAASMGGSATVTFFRECIPTVNNPSETAFACGVMRELGGAEDPLSLADPIMGTDDFAFMLQAVPGCYMFIGNQDEAHCQMVHHPLYDYNDRILPTAAALFVRLIETKLPLTA